MGNWEHEGFPFTGNLRPVLPRAPLRKIPKSVKKPDHYIDGIPHAEEADRASMKIDLYDEAGIAKLRAVADIGRAALDLAGQMVDVGVTCDEIDEACHKLIIGADAYPSPYNYRGFPKSVCTSVNEVICHGIPDGYALQDGDIVNVDISVYKDGFHADLNETFLVGNVDDAGRNLVKTAHDALEAAIAMARPGVRYRDFGNVITKVAKKNKCAVDRTYCGHGVGRLFHGNPSIPHYKNNRAFGVLEPGHCFTIEPMINEGTDPDATADGVLWSDSWTHCTRPFPDGRPRRSAQFEHMLLVTEDGVEVLTRRKHGTYDNPKADAPTDQAAASNDASADTDAPADTGAPADTDA